MNLQSQVQHIVRQLELDEPIESDDDEGGAYDYLADALDIEYIVSGDKSYLGARVLVAFGGPNIWINTRNNQVEGYWWNESYSQRFDDKLGLDDCISELWECI